ncbi:hypothetical protein ACLOJK_036439 [Asimina triloba]
MGSFGEPIAKAAIRKSEVDKHRNKAVNNQLLKLKRVVLVAVQLIQIRNMKMKMKVVMMIVVVDHNLRVESEAQIPHYPPVPQAPQPGIDSYDYLFGYPPQFGYEYGQYMSNTSNDDDNGSPIAAEPTVFSTEVAYVGRFPDVGSEATYAGRIRCL